jgi:hypothetical protein
LLYEIAIELSEVFAETEVKLALKTFVGFVVEDYKASYFKK